MKPKLGFSRKWKATPFTYHAPRETGLQYVSESFDRRGVAGLGQEGS